MMKISIEQYIKDPCRASSLPYWKMEQFDIPNSLLVVRDDEYKPEIHVGKDRQYFKMIHHLENIDETVLPNGFEIVECSIEEYANHINECYEEEGLSFMELLDYQKRPTYNPSLWIAIKDKKTNKVVATIIGEVDKRIGEGIIEWVQVSEEYRRLGLGKYLVCENLRKMKKCASFAVVSGNIHTKSNPFKLYEACGFIDPVIWHVIQKD